MARPSFAVESAQQLQLEVFINGRPSGLIGSFLSSDGRHLEARPEELAELGLDIAGRVPAAETVRLDGIAGLTYAYDVARQTVHFEIEDRLRGTIAYDAGSETEEFKTDPLSFGALVNYDLFATAGQSRHRARPGFEGASATLDGRIFGRLGTLGQGVIFRTGTSAPVRLDTAYSYSDPHRMMTYMAGDVISGGLAWTRPVRLGGLRAFRDFHLRSDLVTQPLASVSDSAGVPSTVDVWVNGLKTFGAEVGPGPFQIDGIGGGYGPGEARVVIRDASGRERVSVVKLFSSPALLRPGLIDFSVEAGLPRVAYATDQDRYLTDKPASAASLRIGLANWLTAEAHGEAAAGLVNGGAGAVLRAGGFGIASVALAASGSERGNGLQTYASFETALGMLNLSASSQLTFGAYEDLASVTALSVNDKPILAGFPGNAPLLVGEKPAKGNRAPRMLNRVSVATSLEFGSLSASYVDYQPFEGRRSRLLTASFSRELFAGGYFDASAFVDFDRHRGSGVTVGLSFPLGGDIRSSARVASGPDGTGAVAEFSKPLDSKPGSFGWRIGGGADRQYANATYRSGVARLDGAVDRVGDRTVASASVNGAVAAIGSDVFLSPAIDDAFAVVRTGVPGVPVLYENREVGKTDRRGRLLVGLRSYEKNLLTIDPTDFPVDADVGTTRKLVVPAGRGGVGVDFKVDRNSGSAVLILSRADGGWVAVGSQGRLSNGQDFTVGYDGRAYVQGLSATNRAEVTSDLGTCVATFAFSAKPGTQQTIPVRCE